MIKITVKSNVSREVLYVVLAHYARVEPHTYNTVITTYDADYEYDTSFSVNDDEHYLLEEV